jgi:hypothetical protein
MDTWSQDGLSVSTHNEGFYNIIMYGNVSDIVRMIKSRRMRL